MTTIAYRDGILAADSQETMGGMKLTSAPKITFLPASQTLIALAGDSEKCTRALAYFNRPDWREKVDEAPFFKKGFEAVVVTKERAYYCVNNCVALPLGNPFIACASGWQLAMAALHMGLGPEDAVKFASELDVYTNSEVQVVNVKDVFKEEEAPRSRRNSRRKAASEA